MASKRREAIKTLIRPERNNDKMEKPPIYDESIGLKKGPWTSEEDQKLKTYIETHGHRGWRALANNSGLNRCGKSCRLRWINYLRPNIKRDNFTKEEEQTILHWQSILGNKWSSIASYLPGRTDNQIKNFWNTRLRKKLRRLGFDPTMPLPYLRDLINQQQFYNHHAMRMQMEFTDQLLFYGRQHLFDPTVTAPPLSVSVMSSYCQSFGAPLDSLCSTASFSVTENLESQQLVQQHQNQSLWLSQLCVDEQQVHDVLPSNYVSTTSSVARSPYSPDNLEAVFLLES